MALLRIVDKAYAAGLFDGEESVGTHWHPSRNHLQVRVRLANTNPVMLAWLQQHFGGTIRPVNHGRAKWKPSWVWDISGPRMELFLKAIRPFLTTKGPAVDTALAIRALTYSPRPRNKPLTDEERAKRGALVLQLHQLNKRGVA
jgi:hypothetical protein